MTTEFKKFNVYAYFEQANLSQAMLTLKMMAFRGDTKSFGNLFDMTLRLRDHRGASSLYYRNRAEITVRFLCVVRNRPFRAWLLSCQKCVSCRSQV